jgi:hypothetical protein
MSAATAVRPARPATPAAVIRLQYANANRMIGIPLYILGAVILLTVLISLAILRAGGTLDGADYNASVLWSIVGYMVAVGVQSVATSFPFALALGTTRRTFVLGNLLTSLVQALLVAAASVVLLGLELATGGWFLGAHVMSSTVMGSGNGLVLAGVMLLTILGALSVGGVFAAAWVRFGSLGPLSLAIGIVLVAIVLLLLLLPIGAAVEAAAATWWIAVAGAVVIGLSVVGQYLFLRRASVR